MSYKPYSKNLALKLLMINDYIYFFYIIIYVVLNVHINNNIN